MIDLAGDPNAAGATYCVASDDAVTVGELARTVGQVTGHRVNPIAIPGPLLALVRAIVWNDFVRRLMPRFAQLSFWRLSLLVSDGFWFDASRFRRAYPNPMRSLREALREMLERGRA
jgi:nucleoside-diphosphate-sugar epimerase